MSGVTLADGSTITAEMSPLERHNAVAKSLNLPTVARPAAPTFGPQGMTPETANQMARGEAERAARAAAPPPDPIAGKAPPPSPQTLERGNATPGQTSPAVMSPDVDQAYVAKLQARYQTLAADGMKLPTDTQEQRNSRERFLTTLREQFDRELQEAYAGRRMGEKRADFEARRASGGAPPGVAAVGRDPATGAITFQDADGKVTNSPAGMGEALDKAAKAAGKDGFAPASAITGPLLHGYEIPQNREYHVAELVSGLRLARIGNLSQAQVSAILAKGFG